ncbi:MAG: low molecular weight protein-tyrosine-phosphatase [Rickettsiales bacterium]|nr:low molecular weight protein-tyrosine-phosphatase [Rickettsiales bacterium]
MNILFVCTGNICRSPSADGIMRHKLEKAGLGHVTIDSAGTHDYHVGEAPDSRSINTAKKRGYDIGYLRARQVKDIDFNQFDLILGLDRCHVESLRSIAPRNKKANVALFLSYVGMGEQDVPDPYYGSQKDFEYTLDLIEAGCDLLLEKLGEQ